MSGLTIKQRRRVGNDPNFWLSRKDLAGIRTQINGTPYVEEVECRLYKVEFGGKDAIAKIPESQTQDAYLNNEAMIFHYLGQKMQPIDPRIVDFFGYGEIDRIPLLLLEFIPGKNLCQELEDLRKKNSPMSFKTIFAILKETTGVLAAIHSCRIAYADLKTEHLFLLGQGREDIRLKMIDFGLSRRSGRLLEIEKKCGSISYSDSTSHPDISTNNPRTPHTIRTDLFSLGAVFYELLSTKHNLERSADHPLDLWHPWDKASIKPENIIERVNALSSPQVLLDILHRLLGFKDDSYSPFRSCPQTYGYLQKVEADPRVHRALFVS